MKKKILLFMFGCILLIGLVSALNIDLSFPPNNTNATAYSQIFNCNATGSPLIYNVSLYTNITGTWSILETLDGTTDGGGGEVSAPWGSQTDITNTAEVGFTFMVKNGNRKFLNATKRADDDSTRALLRHGNGTLIATSNFVGTVATFSTTPILQEGGTYTITADSNGASRLWRVCIGGTCTYPDTSKLYINWTAGYGAYQGATFTKVGLSNYGNNLNQTFSQTINNDIIWNCEVCNLTSCSMNSSNYTLNMDKINTTIYSPSDTTSSLITINATITKLYGTLDKCFYNITRGASTEKTNTNINCSAFNDTYTLSGIADYVLNIYANTTTGIEKVTSTSFSYTLSGVGGGGGGGGVSSIIESLAPPKESICKKYEETWIIAWEKSKTMLPAEKVKTLRTPLFDYLLCKSSASIVPI